MDFSSAINHLANKLPYRFFQPRGDSMNKSELIDAIARHSELSKAAAGRALDVTVAAVKGAL